MVNLISFQFQSESNIRYFMREVLLQYHQAFNNRLNIFLISIMRDDKRLQIAM